jgi:hypothetical protein
MACMMDGPWWVGRHGGDFEVPAEFVDLNWGERGGFLHDVFRTPLLVLIARGAIGVCLRIGGSYPS